MECENMGENSSEMINRLTKQLEHSRDLNDLFIRFIDVDSMNIPKEVKDIIKTKMQVVEDDKNN